LGNRIRTEAEDKKAIEVTCRTSKCLKGGKNEKGKLTNGRGSITGTKGENSKEQTNLQTSNGEVNGQRGERQRKP